MEQGGEATRRAEDRGLGPVLGGLVIDAVDAATFGPVGVWLGLPAGALAGWLLTRPAAHRLPPWRRAALVVLAAVYCAVPWTAPFPVATGLALAARWLSPASRGRSR